MKKKGNDKVTTSLIKKTIQRWREEKKKEIIEGVIKLDEDYRLLTGEEPEWSKRLKKSIDKMTDLAKSGVIKPIQKKPDPGGKLARPKKTPYNYETEEEEEEKILLSENTLPVGERERLEQVEQEAASELIRIVEIINQKSSNSNWPESYVKDIKIGLTNLKDRFKEANSILEFEKLISDIENFEKKVLSFLSVKKRKRKPKPKTIPIETREEQILYGGVS